MSEEENLYEPVGFFNTSHSEVSNQRMAALSSGQSVVRPRPRPNAARSASQQNGNLIDLADNDENERRVGLGVGGLYEPMWMGQTSPPSSRHDQNDDDFMDLGTPSANLQIRSSRMYANTPTEEESPSSPQQPLHRKDSRPIKIRGLNDREPDTSNIGFPESASSAAHRFSRSGSQHDDGRTATPARSLPPTSPATSPHTPQPRQATTPTTASEPVTPLEAMRQRAAAARAAADAAEATGGGAAAGASGGAARNAGATAGLASPISSPGYDFSNLPEKMRDALGLNEGGGSDGVYGWNVPPEDESDAPPPYVPKSAFKRGTQKSLKQSQVELLQKEMSHTGGVKVLLRRTDCHHTIAFIDYQNKVWIAGWNQKARPFLHSAFHVGDRLVCVNGQVVESSRMAQKLIKHCSENDKITFIIRRVPYAKVHAVRREENGQSLAIRREGGTGEIIDVEPYGLAARHGLTNKAQSLDGTNLCNWFLTEINSRPVNLYYKGDEIERRLNAVGKDISFMVQPVEFIDVLKKELKSSYKNYKDFIVE